MIYKYLLKPIFFLFDPELVHEVMVAVGETLGRFRLTRFLTHLIYGYRGSDISKTVDGLTYQTPLLLSAGFDYNARLTQILPFIGFGGVEVGSVTARPCAGNPRPRLTRLPAFQSIAVNKGLKNDGVEAIIKRLKKRKRFKNFVVGVSIARTNDNRSSGVEEGIADYLYSLRRLNEEGVGDYYTLNISCPNAFTGEMFLDPALLRQLLQAVETVKCEKPIYIKMPLHLPADKFLELLAAIDQFKIINGLVIGNLDKSNLALGKLSGLPTQEKSNTLIKLAREQYGRRFTIFGVGGIFSPADAKAKMDAGADLLQLITGMIYHGPDLLKRLNRAF